MGLEGVSEFIRKKHPEVIKENHISHFAFKKICVDISGFIYRYMSIYGKNDLKWLQSFINLILIMKNNFITFIPVFDGKPPIEKIKELNSRKEVKNNIKNKVNSLESDLIEYFKQDSTDQIDSELLERLKDYLQKIKKEKTEDKVSLIRKFINKDLVEKKENQNKISDTDIQLLRDYLNKQKGYLFSITENDIKLLKNLFEVFNISYIQSKSEGEQTCCSLVNDGLCDAIISSDTDCIAHRVNTFIFSFDLQNGMVKYIEKKDLIKSFDFEDEEQLTDFGILVGCDYNKSKKIKNIGPVKAYQLIKEYKNLETIKEKMNIDIDSIDYIRCRELFHYQLNDEEKLIKRWIKPEIETIYSFLNENNLFYNLNKIEKSFNTKLEIEYI
jgi:5'-3' exonuclease